MILKIKIFVGRSNAITIISSSNLLSIYYVSGIVPNTLFIILKMTFQIRHSYPHLIDKESLMGRCHGWAPAELVFKPKPV